MVVLVLIIAVCLSLGFFFSKNHYAVVSASFIGLFADILDFFILQDALNLVNCLVTHLQEACNSGIKVFI